MIRSLLTPMSSGIHLLGVLVLMLVLSIMVSAAQEGADTADSIASKLYFEDIPLNDCTHPTCDAWRANILESLAQGETADEIIYEYVNRYGYQVLGITANDVNAIAAKLYCPVCENIPLDTCPTAACRDWRNEIGTYLSQGMTEDEIIDDFVVRFGDRVVGTPRDPVLRALSLMTPWVIVALMLIAAVYTLMRWRGQSEPVDSDSRQPANGSPDDDYLARLEQDLVE